MRRLGCIRPGLTATHRRVWLALVISLAAATLGSGCADLHDRTSIQSSFAPETARSYLYGRFSLKPGSATTPRLFVQLSNLTTGEFLTIHLASNSEEMYLIDVAPGRYQFTHLLSVPPLAALPIDVRRDPLRLPPALSFFGQPFDVEAGNAYYVGDWVGAQKTDVDYYVVVSRIKREWGIYRLRFDYETATADMKQRYPAMEQMQTWGAWRERQ